MTINFGNGLTKFVLALSILIASIALLLFSIGNARALQTTAIHLGSNPVVSFYCYSTSSTYTVPAGSDLVITDITSPDYLVLKADNTVIWTHYANYSYTSKHYSLTTGFVATGGSVVNCSSGSGYVAGYLVKS